MTSVPHAFLEQEYCLRCFRPQQQQQIHINNRMTNKTTPTTIGTQPHMITLCKYMTLCEDSNSVLSHYPVRMRKG